MRAWSLRLCSVALVALVGLSSVPSALAQNAPAERADGATPQPLAAIEIANEMRHAVRHQSDAAVGAFVLPQIAAAQRIGQCERLAEGEPEAFAFLDALRIAKLAVSLGGTETLASHPASMTHATYDPAERARHGFTDGLIRISVGLEDYEDLREDLLGAL